MPSAFREPLRFRFHFLWAFNSVFKIAIILAAMAMALLAWRYAVAPWLAYFGQHSAILLNPWLSALLGVFIGALISAYVSFFLHRDEFKGQSLRSKRENIYKPLYDDVISLLGMLSNAPYPWHIAHESRIPQYGLRPQAAFHTWSDVSSDERIIHVPKWLRGAFDAYYSELRHYNESYRECDQKVGSRFEADLVERGLLESANGFGQLSMILSEAYDEPVPMPFTVMKHGSSEAHDKFEAMSRELLPGLFREYGELPSVRELRALYKHTTIEHAEWLKKELERVIQLIEIKYGSRDRYL